MTRLLLPLLLLTACADYTIDADPTPTEPPPIHGWWVLQSQGGRSMDDFDDTIIDIDGGRMWREDGGRLTNPATPCWFAVDVTDADPFVLVDAGDLAWAWRRDDQPGNAERWSNAWSQNAAFPCGETLDGCPGYSEPVDDWCPAD